MRQFKFRAWHSKFKRMLDFDFSRLWNNQGWIEFEKGNAFSRFEPSNEDVRVMQYLGKDCKDLHGVELCEGDIIEFKTGSRRIIVFYSGSFITEDIVTGSCIETYYFFKSYAEFKIIGNIHQNPELLGK